MVSSRSWPIDNSDLGASFAFIAPFSSLFIFASSGGGAASVDDHLDPESAHLRAQAEHMFEVDGLYIWRKSDAIVQLEVRTDESLDRWTYSTLSALA